MPGNLLAYLQRGFSYGFPLRQKPLVALILRKLLASSTQAVIRRVEGEQRKQRQEIFTVEDEIEACRDALIDTLEKRLHRASRSHTLFTVRWTLN